MCVASKKVLLEEVFLCVPCLSVSNCNFKRNYFRKYQQICGYQCFMKDLRKVIVLRV